jgi:hypothetical protein
MSKSPRIISWLLMVAGGILLVAGGITYATVSSQLGDQRITVTADAPCQQGEAVNGPLEAYCMAEIINEHAAKSTGGKTYAELDREDPLRATAMNASFLQASLFTSVIAFGVAAFAMGMGLVSLLTGWAIRALDSNTRKAIAPAQEPVTA